MIRTVPIIALILAFLATGASAATLDPGFRFMTRETEHFIIHWHQSLEETAGRAEAIAERSHALLSRTLGWSPTEKTHLVLTDSFDLANGFATVLPYNLIYVYTVPPLPDMDIGQYEDWLGMVITHEYAHVLTMDASRGYSSLTRRVFGKPLPGADPVSFISFLLAAPPNVLLPDWWLEGVSVWAETEFGGLGRGSGTFYEMYLRSAVAEDALPGIDMINGDPPDWPASNRAYIYGLALMRHISRHYDKEALRDLNTGHAGRMPYLITAPARRATGKGYSALFRDAMAELEEEQGQKIQAITEAGLTVPALYPSPGESMTNPAPSPDGGLLAVRLSDPHRHEAILILNTATGEPVQELRVRPADNRVSWGPEGRSIYFTEADFHDGYNLYMDLYSYSLEEDRKVRLTRGLRVKEPAVSVDGRVAVITTGPESQSLAILDMSGEAGKASLRVLREYRGMRLSHPSWDPQGRRIVFSMRDGSGMSSIISMDTEDGSATRLLSEGHSLEYPSFAPGGSRIVYISDETGVFNLYEYSLGTGRTRRLSNLLGGALHPAPGPERQRIYFSSYTSGGYRAAYIMYPPYDSGSAAAPVVRASWAQADTAAPGETEAPEPAAPDAYAESSQHGTEDRPYTALPWLLPRFWLPSIWTDHGGTGPAFLTAGQDPLLYHTYALLAGTGGSGRGYYSLEYRYDRFYPSLDIRLERLPMTYSEFFNSTADLYEQQESAEASLGLPLRRLESEALLSIGYERREQKTLESEEPVFEGRRDNVFVSASFTNALRYPFSVSREEGRTVSIMMRDYSRKRNSDVDAREYTGRYEEYIGLGSHRALYFMMAGGASRGERIPQQAFNIGGTYMDAEFPMRGYPPGYRTGDNVAVSTLELRLPALNVQRGPGTMPMFLRQVHAALFVDGGAVWDKGQRLTRGMADLGAGFELRADLTLGYKLQATPALGYAHGFSKARGEDVAYIAVHVDL